MHADSIIAGHGIRLDQHDQALDRGRETLEELTHRMTALEKWRFVVMGALAFAGFQIPILVAVVLKYGPKS